MLGFPPPRSDAEALYFPLNNKQKWTGVSKRDICFAAEAIHPGMTLFSKIKIVLCLLILVAFFFNLMLNFYACRTGRLPLISMFRISIILA